MNIPAHPAEPDLREPAEPLALLRSVVDAAPEALLCIDSQRRVTLMNQRLHELWPVAPDTGALDVVTNLRETLLANVLDPEALSAEFARMRENLHAESSGRLALRDGRHLEWRSRPLWHDGHRLGRLFSFLDITAQVRADESLQQRLRLETSIARIAAALTSPGELDLDGVLAELGHAVNVHRTYIMRFHADGITCDNTHEWCAEGVHPEIDNLQNIDTSPLTWWWSAMGKGDPVVINDITALPPEGAVEQEFLGAQGIKSLLALPIISHVHGLIGFVGYDDVQRPRLWTDDDLRALRVVSDLLAAEIDRRRAADALRASKERLTQVLDATTDGFWHWDVDADVVEFSARWYEILHEPPTVGSEPAAQWWQRIHPDDREAVEAAVGAHLRGDTPRWQSEQRVRDGRGEWRWIVTRGRVVDRYADGRPRRAVGTHTDITGRRQLEEQLQQAQKMEAVGQLAGGIAHDFNNLLTAVIGHAAFLAGRLDPADDAHGHALEIQAAANRAAELTRQLLAFGRKQLLMPQVLDLCGVVSGMERMLSRLIGTHIQLHTDCRPHSAFVRADPGQLQQVLLNLVMNARDAMPTGGRLQLAVHAAHTDQPLVSPSGTVPPGDWVVLSVTDTGEGIDPANMPRIFEPFFTTKEQGKGTGLGLAMVYGIVAQSEGHVWVSSAPGAGAVFRLYLPRVEGSLIEAAPDAALAGVEPSPATGSGRILVVEDDAAVRRVVTKVLRMSGYTTIEAESPEVALHLAAGMPPVDLILTDMVMPGMDGAALVAQLRARWPDTPVLFMSGYSDLELAESGIVNAGFAFLGKPFTPRSLAAKVGQVMSEGRPEVAVVPHA